MSEVVITVRGEHEARVAPEEGIVRLSVRAEGPERGGVVERISALSEPLRTDLSARKEQGGVREWSSQRVAVWANRPWNAEGKQLSLVHYASVEFSAVFTDFAALSPDPPLPQFRSRPCTRQGEACPSQARRAPMLQRPAL